MKSDEDEIHTIHGASQTVLSSQRDTIPLLPNNMGHNECAQARNDLHWAV